MLAMFTCINNATMNMGVQISFQVNVFIFFVYIPKNVIVESYDSSIVNFLRNYGAFGFWVPSYLPEICLGVGLEIQDLTSILKNSEASVLKTKFPSQSGFVFPLLPICINQFKFLILLSFTLTLTDSLTSLNTKETKSLKEIPLFSNHLPLSEIRSFSLLCLKPAKGFPSH